MTLLSSVKETAPTHCPMTDLRLPFGHFFKKDPRTNGVSDAWQLDLHFSGQPYKFFSLLIFQNGPADNPSVIAEVGERCRQIIKYQQDRFEGQRITVAPDDFFEQCLQKINQEITAFLRDFSAPLPVHSWSMIIGMLTPDQVPNRMQFHVSRFGDVTGWLLNNAQLETKKLISIFDTSDQLQTQGIPQKFFRNIISSSIPQNDQIFFCTPNLLNYISLTELKQILSTLSVLPAGKHIENQIHFQGPDRLVAGISLRLSPYPLRNEDVQRRLDLGAETSMENLNTTEAQTQKLLGNSAGFHFSQLLGPAADKLKNIFPDKRVPKHAGEKWNEHQSLPKKVLTAVKHTFLILLRLVRGTGSSQRPSTMDLLSTNQAVTRTSTWKKMLLSIFDRIIRPIRRFITPNLLKSPVTYLVIILLAGSFTGLSIWRSSVKQTKEEKEQVSVNLAQIRNSINRIDAHLIVGREADATELLQTTLASLTSLPEIEEFASERSTLMASLEEQQRKLRKEIRLQEGSLLVDNLSEQLKGPAAAIFLDGDALTILSQSSTSALRINPQTLSAQQTDIASDAQGMTSAVRIVEGTYALIQRNNVTQVDYAAKEAITSTANTQADLVGAAFFNNRLYTVAPSLNQILRSNQLPSLSVFSNWMTEEADLSNARDIAIDGSVYVLTPNNVLQFLRGRAANPRIQLALVDPPLENAQRLFTSADTQRLYILEPNRLLVFNKTGSFMAQYVSDGASPFEDLTVDLVKNAAYVITADKLYRIEL